ncbi:MAG: (2Fe-2S)-binding protein [Gammaproteobacteria bacterium]|nr:(2Fe-2S)-binding protein [Gammaproteobacteria bacterium]
MYVCICKAITEKQVNHAISDGLCSRRQLTEKLGVGSECGKCVRQVSEMIRSNQRPTESELALQ